MLSDHIVGGQQKLNNSVCSMSAFNQNKYNQVSQLVSQMLHCAALFPPPDLREAGIVFPDWDNLQFQHFHILPPPSPTITG